MIGIDNCHNFIKICKLKDLNVILGNMDDLPLETNSGIGLICIAAFHHLKTVELRLKTLAEFKRVLIKGSRLMISVWSINQGDHKKLKFVYGDNLVPWTKHGKTHQRYYYIFKKVSCETFSLTKIKQPKKKRKGSTDAHTMEKGWKILSHCIKRFGNKIGRTQIVGKGGLCVRRIVLKNVIYL